MDEYMNSTSRPEYDGDFSHVMSTGSTLLDLAISGERIRGGGLPMGIMVEVFGPEGAGKTVMLLQIAGQAQRENAEVWYNDTEWRLDPPFAKTFGFNIPRRDAEIEYPENPVKPTNSIIETFSHLREGWKVEEAPFRVALIDSLAGLDEPDTEGGFSGARRAAVFTDQIRRTAPIIRAESVLAVCSNQIRDNITPAPWAKKTKSAGASRAALHQFSLRLEITWVKKIKAEKTIRGVKTTKTIGTEFEIEVIKSSVGKPYRQAPVRIRFDYGVDDLTENLLFVKKYFGDFSLPLKSGDGRERLGGTLGKAIENVEEHNLEEELKATVIDLWEEIELAFKPNRKRRF
jgi:recombination protein RecA